MPYFALAFFLALSLLSGLFLLALSRWWSPSAVERGGPRTETRLPLHAHRLLFFVLIGEIVLIFCCVWAVHFKTGLAIDTAHLHEMGNFASVVFVGVFYLWRKEGRG